MKKRIYLAGAIGCYDPEDNHPYKWRRYVKGWISNFYDDKFSVFNPIDYYNYKTDNQYTEKEIMKYELRAVKQSDVVLVNLKDLDKSTGTNDEILYAYLNDVPIIGFIESDVCSIHAWKEEQIDRIEIGEDSLEKALNYIAEYF